VDDSADDRLLARRVLAREWPDLDVIEIADAAALAVELDAGGFDVVVTDYHASFADGLDVLRAVKARQPDCPVIMFTATGNEEISVGAMKAGLDDYVLKYHVVRLPSAVQAALERARDRLAAREAETRYRDLFASIPVGVYQAEPGGRLIDVNPAWVEIMGYPDRESALASDAYSAYLEPADRDLWMAAADRGELRGFECQVRRHDGEIIWLRITGRAVKDSAGQTLFYEGTVEDVTERKRTERELEKLAALVESSMDFVGLGSLEGRVEYVNRAGRALVGLGPDEDVTRLTLFDFVPEEDSERLVKEVLPEIEERGYRRSEGRLRHFKTGEAIPVEAYSIKIVDQESGEPIAIANVSRDLRERKEAEEALRRSQEQLLQSQKMEAVGRLAGGVAHDFNNLLTAVSGYSDLLLSRLEDPVERRDVEEIAKASERAAALTRQLLAFSRKQVLRPRVVDLNEVVVETEEMLRRLLGADVDFQTALELDPLPLEADPQQLQQVIVNLAVNARDAMLGGGTLTVETRGSGGSVFLAVKDTGHGMDADVRSHAFEPFFTTKAHGKGTGLGLATVHGIVEQSGGSIELESEPGSGTSFEITFPRAEAPAKGVAAERRPSAERGSETVLLVEDYEIVEDLIRQVLEGHGYTVVSAKNGEEALELATRHAGPIDLLLTDLVMPKMGGRELAGRLASLHPETKVLHMSGYADADNPEHGAIVAGAAFIAKPFSPDALALKVREVLEAS